jgi:hypothetical protein
MPISRSGTHSRIARRASWLAVLSLTGAALLIPASVFAHTPHVSLTCEGGLIVDLADYKAGPNTVTITIDGTAVAGSPFSFNTDFSQTFVVAPPTVPHTASVAIFAWDDPTGSKGFTQTFDLSVEACVAPTPTPTPGGPTPVPTPTPGQPTPAPTPTPGQPTPTPTGGVGGSTATPTGGVGGSTGTPASTLPPTNTIDRGAGSTDGGVRLILLALAGVVSAALMLTRPRGTSRKDRISD